MKVILTVAGFAKEFKDAAEKSNSHGELYQYTVAQKPLLIYALENALNLAKWKGSDVMVVGRAADIAFFTAVNFARQYFSGWFYASVVDPTAGQADTAYLAIKQWGIKNSEEKLAIVGLSGIATSTLNQSDLNYKLSLARLHEVFVVNNGNSDVSAEKNSKNEITGFRSVDSSLQPAGIYIFNSVSEFLFMYEKFYVNPLPPELVTEKDTGRSVHGLINKCIEKNPLAKWKAKELRIIMCNTPEGYARALLECKSNGMFVPELQMLEEKKKESHDAV